MCVASSSSGGEIWETEGPLGSYSLSDLPFPSAVNSGSRALGLDHFVKFSEFCETWCFVNIRYWIITLFISSSKPLLHLLPHEILQRIGFQGLLSNRSSKYLLIVQMLLEDLLNTQRQQHYREISAWELTLQLFWSLRSKQKGNLYSGPGRTPHGKHRFLLS